MRLLKQRDNLSHINVETIKFYPENKFYSEFYGKYETEISKKIVDTKFNFIDTAPAYSYSETHSLPFLVDSVLVVFFVCKETINLDPASDRFQLLTQLNFLSATNQIFLIPVLIENCDWEQTPLSNHTLYPVETRIPLLSDNFWSGLRNYIKITLNEFAELLQNAKPKTAVDSAFIVGIDNYSSLPLLSQAASSASEYAQWINSLNGGAVSKSNTNLLLSDGIKKYGIESSIQNLIYKNNFDNNRLYLYFNGYGIVTISGDCIFYASDYELPMSDLSEINISKLVENIGRLFYFKEIIVVISMVFHEFDYYGTESRRNFTPINLSNDFLGAKLLFIVIYEIPRSLETIKPSTKILISGLMGLAADKRGIVSAQALTSFITSQGIDNQFIIRGGDFDICGSGAKKCIVHILLPINVSQKSITIIDSEGKIVFESLTENENFFDIELQPGTYKITIPYLVHSTEFTVLANENERTVDLSIEKDWIANWKFNDRYVLVVGTGSKHLTENELVASKEIGKLLAQNGYGLITGGWPGVDNETSKSYFETLTERQIFRDEYISQVIVNKQIPVFSRGKFSEVSDDTNWYRTTAQKAMAVILIGGKRGTSDSLKFISSYNIPVIPLPSSGGFAANFYRNEVKHKDDNYPPDFNFSLNLEDELKEAMKIILKSESGMLSKNKNTLFTDDSESALFSDDSKVLVQELSGPTRWSQANFNYNIFIDYFGAPHDSNDYYISLKYVTSDGQIGEVEKSKAVSVASSNYRFELRAARGLDYPAQLRPVAVFIKENDSSFLYHILMPDTPGYSEINSFIDKREIKGRGNRMRKMITDVKTIRKDCHSLPFWKS